MPTTATAFKQVKDNAAGTLSAAISSTSATTFSVTAGQGANFPQPGNAFWVTIWDNVTYANNPIGDPNMEKVLVTARSTDTFTCTRAQLGTAAATHVSGAKVQLLTYAQQITDLQTAINDLETTRLKASADITTLTQDSTLDQVEVTKDSAPLSYTDNSYAAVVWQNKQTTNLTTNQLIPAFVIQNRVAADGVVNAAAETSSSIWQGLYVYGAKTGDASVQVITIGGEIGTTGAGGYSELGGLQGTLTNKGASKGNISGWEVILRDSELETTIASYDTRMQGVISRIRKYNASTRLSSSFTASSEGNKALEKVFHINNGGIMKWQKGFDLTNLVWENVDGTTNTTKGALILPGGGAVNDKVSGAVGITGGFAKSVTVITGATTLTASSSSVIICNGAGAAWTVTLPAATAGAGLQYTIKRNGNTNNITVNGGGTNIDLGTTTTAATRTLGSTYATITCVSNGTTWNTIAVTGTVT